MPIEAAQLTAQADAATTATHQNKIAVIVVANSVILPTVASPEREALPHSASGWREQVLSTALGSRC
jgi:hypothetical protein